MTSWCNLCQSCFSVFGEVNNNSINQSRSRYRAPVEIALGIYKLRNKALRLNRNKACRHGGTSNFNSFIVFE